MTDTPFAEKLKYAFNPRTVAVLGASENPGKLGFHVMKSLTAGGFKGAVVPVNPGADAIMGMPVFPTVGDYPGEIDLAIIVLPAKLVPGVFQECADKGVKGVVLISAGFREIDDPQGETLQNELAELANRAAIPVIGPNTFGMINFAAGLNASFTPEFSLLPRGDVALVSQSGGVSHLIGFMAMRQSVGFSKIVGLGNRLNVDFPEMIEYLRDDPDTGVIALYIEGLDQPRRFVEAIRKSEFAKPVIVYKAGSSRTGNQASVSHTGSLAGKHEIYAGALRQAGALQVENAERLLDTARAFSLCPLPGGNRVAILTGQAGPGMEAADVCEAAGLEMASFNAETQERINTLLPPLAMRTNPVDMGPAWYSAAAIRGIIGAALEDKNVDIILILMMFASANRDAISGFSELLLGWKQRKPVAACLLAPPGVWDEEILRLEAGGALINFPSPEKASRALAALWEYRKMRTGS